MNFLKECLPQNWKQLLAWAVLVLATALGSYYGFIPSDTPIPIPPVPIFEPTDCQANGGWHKDDDAVKAVQDTLRFKVFADTDAGRADDPLPDHVYLWQAYAKLFARGPPSKDQGQIGACVSFGTNNAVARSLAVDIAFKMAPFEFKDPAEEVTYGGSRVQVGGGKIRGDGSVGAWAAKFVQQWGIVAREKQGSYDLSTYSVQRCKEFGQKGVPDDLQKVARITPVKSITQVNTWSDAKKALASGYGIAVCSDQGFTMQRDANGICSAKGSWAHCMCLDGYASINGKEYGHIVNSWGPNAHTGPVGPGDPPPCGFYADSSTVDRMLKQGDSWAFSGVVGFPRREIDWFVQVAPKRPPRLSQEVQYALSP